MPSYDDTNNHHICWPHCRMHFVVETPATKSGLWFPLEDMAVGDYVELLTEEELKACRQVVAYWNRVRDSRFAIRLDVASDDTHICRRIE